MNEKTAEKIFAIVAEYKEVSQEEIKMETTLEELEMDSLDALNLVFELEEEFDIEIPDDKAFEMKTIGEMVEGIDKLLILKEKGVSVEEAEENAEELEKEIKAEAEAKAAEEKE